MSGETDSKEFTRLQAMAAVEAIAVGIALVLPITPSKTGADGSMADMFFAAPTYWHEVFVNFVGRKHDARNPDPGSSDHAKTERKSSGAEARWALDSPSVYILRPFRTGVGYEWCRRVREARDTREHI